MIPKVEDQRPPDLHRPPRFEEYRAHVGTAEDYDVASAIQFNLLTTMGLREHHYLLDIGCGSLRAGRLFIPYLRPGRYFGIEPLEWLVRDGVDKELGESAIRLKRPVFSHDDNFTLTVFDRTFDFLLAQSIFSHASPAQISRCLAEARKVMKPGSVFAATFFEGTENYEGDRWVAHADYTLGRMRELVEAQGLACQPIEWAHQDLQRWILIYLPGAGPRLLGTTDPNRVAQLEGQLALAQRQLLSVRGHPYVRFGRRVKFFVVWSRFQWRRLARALRR